MKRFIMGFAWLFALCLPGRAGAQSSELMVQRDAGGLFLTHTVAPKENFYSIGRLFNASPKEIASYNGLEMARGLQIGQDIKIPLTARNYTGAKKRIPGHVLVPVYRFGDGEKVLAGYLLVVRGQSPLASETAERPEQASKPIAEAPKKPAQAAPEQDPLAAPTNPPPAPVTASGARYAGEGIFKNDYLSQTDNGRHIRNNDGLAGVFKSTSGWDNGKYYALMNHVDRGTIIKVTNLSNNRVVFAKVLGEIADIRQNAGMTVVLSDAAAAQLGVTTDRFTTAISFSK